MPPTPTPPPNTPAPSDTPEPAEPVVILMNLTEADEPDADRGPAFVTLAEIPTDRTVMGRSASVFTFTRGNERRSPRPVGSTISGTATPADDYAEQR